MRTAIERMIGHELEREQRAGVTHFKTGQRGATRVDPSEPDVVQAWWTTGMGAAVFILCMKHASGWEVAAAYTGGQTFVRELGRDVLIPERVRAAMETAA